LQFQFNNGKGYLLPAVLISSAFVLFAFYCYRCFKERLRKRVDMPVKLSLASVAAIAFPLLILFLISGFAPGVKERPYVTVYGITVFFGWLTAIIFGMTFKTLPFIVWTKLRTANPLSKQANDPRTLYSERHFLYMMIAYIAGVAMLALGVCVSGNFLVKASAALLIIAALFYNKSVWMMITRKKL
jgi:hypothetical protein